MSDPTHLMYLKRSLEGWNRWRQDHTDIIPDLSEAYLCAASLAAANLSHACLRKVDLYATDLWCADLSHADVRSANLSSANLQGTNFTQANLEQAEMISANLHQADLSGANLRQANLSMCNLSGANLSGADLSEANLRGAKLTGANLEIARLAGANLTGIMVGDGDISLLASLQQVTCDHIYVLSYMAPETPSTPPANTYTAYFRDALHRFYQRFISACDSPDAQIYRVVWPASDATEGPDIYLQSVEQQADGALLVRVGVPGLKPMPESSIAKPSYLQLISTLGRGDYYRHQLQLKEEQIATYQRQNSALLELLKAMTRQNVYVQSVSVLENNLMTGVSKYDLRGANIGSFAETVTAGGQQNTVQSNQAATGSGADPAIVTELEFLFRRLAHQAAQVPAHQRTQVVGQVIQKKALANPDFKMRLFQAIESGSAELIQVFTQNPYIRIPMAMVKGWVAAS